LLNIISGRFLFRWTLLKPGLYVVTYHRIGNKSQTEFDPNVFSCTSEMFEKHLSFYKKYFDVVTPSQIVQSNHSHFNKPTLCITFDDGYLDNFEVALPLLQKHELPATFFITSNYVKQTQIPWWDEIAWMVHATKCKKFSLDWIKNNELQFDTEQLRNNAYSLHQLMSGIKSNSELNMAQKLVRFQKTLDIKFDINLLTKPLFMNESNVKSIAESGMEIGGHTMNHPILSHLDVNEQAKEINQNKQHLETLIKNPITTFAYPVGGYHCYQDATKDILRQSGYQLAFTYENGLNLDCQDGDYELLRFPVEMNDRIHRLKYMMSFPKSIYSKGRIV
jgi:peptidoglycan/xylan/chitin deacetylase (PgdA/CDA1 family)